MAYRLKLGSVRAPGAGMIPFGTAVLFAFMSLGLSLRAILQVIRTRHEPETVFKGITWGRLVLLVCALLAYGFALDALGFHICTFFLMILLLGIVSRRRLIGTVAISFLTVLFVYLIFEVWLGCPFPRGSFGI
jgi:hypothetical protein